MMTPEELDANGWRKQGNEILAPCGCKATGIRLVEMPGCFPQDCALRFQEFTDCGKTDGCVARAYTRVTAVVHKEVPSDRALWNWFTNKRR